MTSPKRIVVAVTGASGALYAVRFLQEASQQVEHIHVIMSPNAAAVYSTETGGRISNPSAPEQYMGPIPDTCTVEVHSPSNFFTPPASGSYRHDGMIIVPCSMGTLARVASGVSNDLTTRAADVCLKERRRLVLVARETPLSLIHLRNMVSVTEAGAIVLPAVPAFYHQPASALDLVNTVVARMLQAMGLEQSLQPQWAVPSSS